MEENTELVKAMQRLENRMDLLDLERLNRVYYMKDMCKIFVCKRPETVYARLKELGLEPLETRRLAITGRELRRKNLI